MKRAAASAVALSTLASGLSFGVASASASISGEVKSGASTQADVVDVRGLTFSTRNENAADDRTQYIQMRDLRSQRFSTYSEAWVADRTMYRIPNRGKTSLIARLDSNGFPDRCLSHARGQLAWIAWANCSSNTTNDNKWTRTDEDKVQATGTNTYLNTLQGSGDWLLSSYDPISVMVPDSTYYSILRNGDLFDYTVDHNAGSVTLPQWYSNLWGLKINGVQVDVDPEDGRVAPFTVTGLQPGTNRITFEGSILAGGTVFYTDYLEVTITPTLSATVSNADLERGTATLTGSPRPGRTRSRSSGRPRPASSGHGCRPSPRATATGPTPSPTSRSAPRTCTCPR